MDRIESVTVDNAGKATNNNRPAAADVSTADGRPESSILSNLNEDNKDEEDDNDDVHIFSDRSNDVSFYSAEVSYDYCMTSCEVSQFEDAKDTFFDSTENRGEVEDDSNNSGCAVVQLNDSCCSVVESTDNTTMETTVIARMETNSSEKLSFCVSDNCGPVSNDAGAAVENNTTEDDEDAGLAEPQGMESIIYANDGRQVSSTLQSEYCLVVNLLL